MKNILKGRFILHNRKLLIWIEVDHHIYNMRLSGWYKMCLTCEDPGVPWIWLLSNMWSGCTGCENQNCRSTGSRGELVSPSDPSLCLDSGWDEEMWVKLNKTTISLIYAHVWIKFIYNCEEVGFDHPIQLRYFWHKFTLFIYFPLYLKCVQAFTSLLYLTSIR